VMMATPSNRAFSDSNSTTRLTPDGGSLEFSIQCRANRTVSRGAKHPVVIHDDWSVTTPHDLEAERVAAAFGGYCSCLELVDRTVPAFRNALGTLSRRVRTGIVTDSVGSWLLPPGLQADNCCRGHKFVSILSAVRHSRELGHLARLHGVPRWQLSVLASATGKAWGDNSADTNALSDEVSHLVRERRAVEDLRECGVHAHEVREMAAVVSVVHGPLPMSYFLGMAFGNADPEWVGNVIRFRPDPDTAAWLAWLNDPGASESPETWGQWLLWGLPRADVLLAIKLSLAGTFVSEVATSMYWSASKSAKQLVEWAKLDCAPTVAHFRVLARHGVESAHLSRAAVDDLVDSTDRMSSRLQPRAAAGEPLLDRTTLAVLLAVLGTRSEVLHAVRSGVRSCDDIESHVHSVNNRRPE